MRKHGFVWMVGVLLLATLACGQGGGTDRNQALVETAVAQTEAAASLTAAVMPSDTPLPVPTDTPAPTNTPLPTDTPAPTATATTAQTAPDPLPASHTGIILNNGECFDYDTGNIVGAVDGECDIWLAESALLRQVNGAQTSGYVTFATPTLSDCQSAIFDPNDLGVQTDLYMCFHSNQGAVGFIVARDYLGGVPFTGIVIDYWVW